MRRVSEDAGCAACFSCSRAGRAASPRNQEANRHHGGLVTASFARPRERQVHFSSDAAPGDAIAGVVRRNPPEPRRRMSRPTSERWRDFVVELEGQATRVSSQTI